MNKKDNNSIVDTFNLNNDSLNNNDCQTPRRSSRKRKLKLLYDEANNKNIKDGNMNINVNKAPLKKARQYFRASLDDSDILACLQYEALRKLQWIQLGFESRMGPDFTV